jgi:hypothetical protein
MPISQLYSLLHVFYSDANVSTRRSIGYVLHVEHRFVLGKYLDANKTRVINHTVTDLN